MAVAPFNPDETKPTDSDLISQYPAVERTFRDVVESWINIDHDTSGFHKTITLPEQGSDPAALADAGKFYTKDVAGLTQMFYRDAAGTITKIDNFPTGTTMLFQQTAAPVGWTKVTGHNDKVLRLVSGAVSSGGTSPFSTLFGASKVTGGHALTISEMPAHSHTLPDAVVVGSLTPSPTVLSVGGSSAATGTTGSGVAHTHVLAMDLQYIDIILAIKD